LPGIPGERLPFDSSGLVPDDLRLSNPDNMFKLPSLDGPALPGLSTEFGSKKDAKDDASKDEAATDDAGKAQEADTLPGATDEAQKESPPSEPAGEKKSEAAAETSAEPQK
jgi:hypothetical protein